VEDRYRVRELMYGEKRMNRKIRNARHRARRAIFIGREKTASGEAKWA
jgi:hypothetical protein